MNSPQNLKGGQGRPATSSEGPASYSGASVIGGVNEHAGVVSALDHEHAVAAVSVHLYFTDMLDAFDVCESAVFS